MKEGETPTNMNTTREIAQGKHVSVVENHQMASMQGQYLPGTEWAGEEGKSDARVCSKKEET